MKRYLILLLVVILLFNLVFSIMENNKKIVREKRAIFISYIELSKYIKNYDKSISIRNIDMMINNIEKLGFNMIILQVRSFSDAIYKSKIFPWSSSVSVSEGVYPGYDVLDYFIKCAHNKNISIYAWINPYRVRNSGDINSISKDNPAFKYINTTSLYVGNGIFYNPASDDVIDLIVDGVLEIVSNYDVDGILFDDYFYPSNDIDLVEYNEYISTHEYISISDYHLYNVNRMIKKVHDVCHKYKKVFGISPDGNIDNNYNKNFADVKKWCSSGEYIDYIMPQIYYGFYNGSKPFVSVLDEWESIVSSDVDIFIVLAFYKVGSMDSYAKDGIDEWVINNDIIMREIILSRNIKNYKGFALFRYDYLFNEDLKTENTLHEIENMKKILN